LKKRGELKYKNMSGKGKNGGRINTRTRIICCNPVGKENEFAKNNRVKQKG